MVHEPPGTPAPPCCAHFSRLRSFFLHLTQNHWHCCRATVREAGAKQTRGQELGTAPRCVQRGCIRDQWRSSARLDRALAAPPLKGDDPTQPERQQERGARFGDGGRPLTILALVVAVLALAVLTERWQHRHAQQTETQHTRCNDPRHHNRPPARVCAHSAQARMLLRNNHTMTGQSREDISQSQSVFFGDDPTESRSAAGHEHTPARRA